ncbi:MAG: biotin--[acetyl-CoA-carboxylase] ligase [Hyphomicrobiales bacterium]|nr:biotin--[acetyl-CoA-carboxylase] ligase [Hyphomicrobiales bacterium]
MQLDPSAVDAQIGLIALGTIDSTNKEALGRAAAGEHGSFWVTAEAQTAGRGRLGRSWNSPPGNLYASLLLRDPSPFEHAPELAFVAVLALRDAIVAETPALAAKLRFKWPNDLLLADAKCAGILIEGEVNSREIATVVIGIGVNCAHHPPIAAAADGASPAARSSPFGANEVLFPATDLHAQGAEITPERLFARLSATMCARVAQWDRGNGFTAILGDWLTGASGLGEAIHVRQGSEDKVGRFIGLDRAGRLVLELAGGSIEKIAAGDVFPLALRGRPKIPSRRGR